MSRFWSVITTSPFTVLVVKESTPTVSKTHNDRSARVIRSTHGNRKRLLVLLQNEKLIIIHDRHDERSERKDPKLMTLTISFWFVNSVSNHWTVRDTICRILRIRSLGCPRPHQIIVSPDPHCWLLYSVIGSTSSTSTGSRLYRESRRSYWVRLDIKRTTTAETTTCFERPNWRLRIVNEEKDKSHKFISRAFYPWRSRSHFHLIYFSISVQYFR